MIQISHLTRLSLERMLPLILEKTRDFDYNDWKAENFLSDFPDKWLLSIFIQSGHNIAGFSINSRKDDTLHIHYLFVFQEYRKMFLGSKMLTFCEELAKTNNLSKLRLKCNLENYKALNFYFSNNFHIEDIILNKMLYVMVRHVK